MFIDEVEITCIAGRGGDGKTSFLPGYKVIPNGGNGGRGGDIYVITSPDVTLLSQLTGNKKIKAEDGKRGEIHKRTGKIGKTTTIYLPIGSLITEKNTGETIELTTLNQKLLLCKGGEGGKGTWELRTTDFRNKFPAEPGHPGEKKELRIVVKLTADYGLIGLPNAGKSSLLNELTRSHARVDSYPFTTLEPNLGVMDGKILIDVPGLIEGASEGKGLGIKSLKHIEKVHLLIHCISCESQDAEKDYLVIRQELEKFNPILVKKPEIILLTKSDLVSEKEIQNKRKILEKYGRALICSIHDINSLKRLSSVMAQEEGIPHRLQAD